MPNNLILESTAYTLEQLLARNEPQIALAGRSNVGKSSLINALAGRKTLAKVSATPGKTRSINFYRVEPQGYYLVDLPGYGYARASHAERNAWARLLERYLTQSSSLCALALLLDSRLPPQDLDKQLLAFAQTRALPVLPILTKTDKCRQRDVAQRGKEWQDMLGKRPYATSASKKTGLAELWQALTTLALAQPRPASPSSETSTAHGKGERSTD